MTDHQNEPAWMPFVGIIICVMTFSAIFIGLRSTSSLNLVPLIAITVFAGSFVATLLNSLIQAIINASLGLQQEMQPPPTTQHSQRPPQEKQHL